MIYGNRKLSLSCLAMLCQAHPVPLPLDKDIQGAAKVHI